MDEVMIYFRYDTELSEFEAVQRGYRVDVFVKVNNQYFNLRIFDIIRLRQEFESEIESGGYYAVEPNLVLVKEVNKKEIIFAINNLYKQKYFEELKPVDNIKAEDLIEIQ